MRRPRAVSFQRANSPHVNSPPPATPWLDPPRLSPRGSGDGSHRGEDRTRSASFPGSPVGGGALDYGEGDSWKGPAQSLLFQLVFWPLTLFLMLVGSGYRFLLRVGCYGSPLRFRDPPGWIVRLISTPFRLANPPVSLGAENLEACLGVQGGEGGGEARARRSSPVMLVGNHNLLGLDCVSILDEVQRRTGVYPRVLYDTLFGFLPLAKQLLEAAGGVGGSMGNCETLMSEGRCMLLYPGGAREAFKGGGADKYQLMWQEKLGFVRMAVKHGYSVVPFASVGVEDAVSVACRLDVTWLARAAEPDRGPLYLPFLFPYNSLQRQYFAFGKPIETTHLGGDWENVAKCTEVFLSVKGEVERLIGRLKHVQEQDPDRFLGNRVWRRCCRIFRGLGRGGGVESLQGCVE